MAEQKKQLLIVTGMSGAGKTVAIKALEDMGYFVVDNLPPELLGSFWELINNSSDFSKAAVVVDLRVKSFYKDLVDEIKSLEDSQMFSQQSCFLDASDDVLVSRYKETRRLPLWLIQVDCLMEFKKKEISYQEQKHFKYNY